jgi:hypothetical protein
VCILREHNFANFLFKKGLQHIGDVGIFLHFKESLLNVREHFCASHLCDEESLSGTSVLQSTFGSILEVSDHQVALDHRFDSCVPVSVSRDGLLMMNLLLVTHLFYDLRGCFYLLFWGGSLNLRFATKVGEEVGGTFCRHLT